MIDIPRPPAKVIEWTPAMAVRLKAAAQSVIETARKSGQETFTFDFEGDAYDCHYAMYLIEYMENLWGMSVEAAARKESESDGS